MTQNHPEHWRSHTGPANWYRIWHPPTWTLEETEQTTRLVSPTGGGTLVLSCLWRPDWETADLESAVDVQAMFVTTRNIRDVRPLHLPDSSVGWAGEAFFGPAWKRFLSRKLWKPWRVWVVHHEAVFLVAVSLPKGEPDPELQTMAEMILNTLEFADEPADPPQVFADRVLQLARKKFPLLSCRHGENFQIELGDSSINLFNFYRSYVYDPKKFEELMLPALTTVVQVQEWGQWQTEPPLEQVGKRIMPMLYPKSVWRENFPNFIGVPWVADLMILYVVDESQAYWYIREDLLERWNISRDDLHTLALENLDAYFDENAMDFTLAGEEQGPRILMPNRADAYNTARLLSRSFHETLQDLLGKELAVGIPSRDFFVAVSLDSAETLDQIRHKVIEDFAHMDHPLSERLLLVSTDGVSEFCEV